MVGILVFVSEETLQHKLRDGKFSEGNECWWELKRWPKQKVDKIYMAVEGIVKGYFRVAVVDEDRQELVFDSESWVKSYDGEKLKPSQGWRYYNG